MVITGTWTPKDANGVLGTPVAFETYFDADIEVEMDLVPALTIADGVSGNRRPLVIDELDSAN